MVRLPRSPPQPRQAPARWAISTVGALPVDIVGSRVSRTIGISRPVCAGYAANHGKASTCRSQSRRRSCPPTTVALATKLRFATSIVTSGSASTFRSQAGSRGDPPRGAGDDVIIAVAGPGKDRASRFPCLRALRGHDQQRMTGKGPERNVAAVFPYVRNQCVLEGRGSVTHRAFPSIAGLPARLLTDTTGPSGPRLAWFEDDDRDRTSSLGAVGSVPGVRRDETLPEPVGFPGGCRPRRYRTPPARHLDLRFRVIAEVQPPRRVGLSPSVRGNHHQVRPLNQVVQAVDARLTAPPSYRVEEERSKPIALRRARTEPSAIDPT